jgi:hypothetical protein
MSLHIPKYAALASAPAAPESPVTDVAGAGDRLMECAGAPLLDRAPDDPGPPEGLHPVKATPLMRAQLRPPPHDDHIPRGPYAFSLSPLAQHLAIDTDNPLSRRDTTSTARPRTHCKECAGALAHSLR